MRQEHLPVDGELRSPRRTHQEPHPQVLLQRGDPLGHRLLGERQVHGGLLELPGIGDRDEGAYGFEVHGDTLPSHGPSTRRRPGSMSGALIEP
ncbi:hypothetical protein SAFG77S_01682 [Streptomyces afghaniensis]